MQPDDAGAGGPPGRVVMLVDNDVRGDSRVQKAARSAAAAGWEVTLLGRALGPGPRSWRVGKVTVRLLATPEARRRNRTPAVSEAADGLGHHLSGWVRAWRADERLRAGGSTPSGWPPWPWSAIRWTQLVGSMAARRLPAGLGGAYTRAWTRIEGDRAWRHLEPGLWDFELAYGPVIDELAPDIIHAHDFRMIGVGARAKLRAQAAGGQVRLVWDAHEYLPGVTPWYDNGRWLPAHLAYEHEYVRYADAVITVSETLAELLRQQHQLPDRPAVMLNAPSLGPAPPGAAGEPVPDLREICGVGPTTPLLVYSGTAPAQRGIDIMIESLPALDTAHVALVVSKSQSTPVQQVLELARRLGVQARVHLVPYVPYWQVPAFLSAADVGVIPIHHWPNYEIALIQKFLEYSQARLPIVVSDLRTMAETVRRTGQGEVFVAKDLPGYIRAVRAVLADPARYRAAYDQPGLLESWTWEAQEPVLDEVYRRLATPTAGGATAHAAGSRSPRRHPAR